MEKSAEVYQFLEAELRASFAACDNLTEIVASAPVPVQTKEIVNRQQRHRTFQRFFQQCRDIFSRCVQGGQSDALRRMLLHDSESFMPPGFYERLPKEAWTIPLFFRTDESKSGRVFEVQCPGSGWGDLPLLARLYRKTHPSSWLDTFTPEGTVADDITVICGVAGPSVLHLLDNASNPVSMKYFMSLTQPPLRYCGFEKSAANNAAQFVRSHSVFGLVSENLFRRRLEQCAQRELWFDLPPLVIFDQKMMLALPFLDETREAFDDNIRDILSHTYPVTADGFRDADGQWVTIGEFLARSHSKRRYFLKYAGADTNRNWGSRSVYRLTNNKADALLKHAIEDGTNGLPWIIQPEIAEKENITFFGRESDGIEQTRLTAKYSAFYGPSGLVGLRTMHRNHHNVHGQADTIIGLAHPGD